MSTPTMTAPLSGCVTIDSTTPDGYLDNTRAGNPHAGSSGSTAVAASNLLACEQGQHAYGIASLVGHGQEGDIDTCKATGECITVNNEDAWTPSLQTLNGKVTELFLFGCSVGGGDPGAQLLYDIAKVINAPVSAPTGLIYCDAHGNFTLEPGAVWQTATAAAKPAPIPPPVHQAPHAMTQTPNGNPPPEVLGQILGASYVSNAPGNTTGAASMATSFALAGQVLWAQPFVPPGEPGAKVTGLLDVLFEVDNQPRNMSFIVYNDVLVRQIDKPIFYYTTPKFRALAQGS